jgi:4'-phosphopantetheinyl transferase
MPLENVRTEATRTWALWNIKENESWLQKEIAFPDNTHDTINNPYKKLEYLTGRLLIKHLLSKWNLPYQGLTKDEFGKPFLVNHNIHISLSHSYPYVAAVLDKNQTVGIDLEQPKDKLLKIAPRVLNATELQDASHDITKHCIYWCAKEALIKIYGKKDLILSKNLAISPFLLQKKGFLTGSILANGLRNTVPLYYEVYDNFVVVLNK